MTAAAPPVLIPVGTIGQRLDNDDPDYIFAPDTYLTLALAYDSMAAPGVIRDRGGVFEPDYKTMQPRLAAGWEEQANGDWIVQLRPGVTSPAGHEFTAADLVWVFEKIAAQDVMAAWRWQQVVGVRRLEVLDRHRIRFHLRGPYPIFPNWLISVSPNMVDSAAIRAHATAADPWGIEWLNGHAAGFGAYELKAMDAEHLAFAARADYWMGRPDPAAIEARLFPDRRSAIAQLNESRPAVLVGLDPDETAKLLKREDLTVLRTWAGHVSVEIDFTAPPFDDPRVRHALAFATPSDRIIADGLLGLARPWRSPVKSFSQWYSDAAWHYDFNIARARELLASAGYGNGLKSDFYVRNRADCRRIAEIIAGAWREAGIELVLRDLAEAPPGWLPPLFLRTECAHNVTEPIYDLAHDYAPTHPILPRPGGPAHVGNWAPRWKKNEAALDRFGDLLCECDAHLKRRKFMDLQDWLIDFGSSIFIAEGQQTMVANRHVPAGLLSPGGRFFQALNHQNCTTNYLPSA